MSTAYGREPIPQFDEEELGTKAHVGKGEKVGWVPVSEEHVQGLRDQDLEKKGLLRKLRLFIRLATFALSIFTLYTQAETLHTYLSTRGIVRQVGDEDRNAWASTTTIWPTILLLTVSSLSILISLVILVGYFWSVKHANKANTRLGQPLSLLELVAHMVIWIATAIGYRVGKTGSDLWGWSCSGKAQGIQVHFEEVDFDLFCSIQSDAWIASLAQVALFIVTCLAWFLAWQRSKHQKKLRHRESLLPPAR